MFKNPLSEEMKDQLVKNDELFKVYVIDKLERLPVCEKGTVKNNIAWLKGLVLGLYTLIIGGAISLFIKGGH